MPPLYPYRDEISGYQLDVLRGFEESSVPPTAEELAEDVALRVKHGLPEIAVTEPRWIRVFDTAPVLQRGPNWKGAKGFW